MTRRRGIRWWSAAALAAAWICAAHPAHAGVPPVLFTRTRFVPPGADSEELPAKHTCLCNDPSTRARDLKCFPQLVIHDTAKVFTSPARWHAKQWGLFSLEVAGVGALAFADDEIRTAVLNHHSPIGDRIAKIDEPFGTWASFVVLAGFFTGGAIAGDPKARGVAVDGLTASFIASGLIVPVLKKIAGRSRPREGYGPYNFFQGGASFPSGHVTQAFTVATVIATEYPSRWVQAACYGPAALVAYARMRHDAHWASDVAASVFIGFGVGRAVARLNLPPRLGDKRVRFVPAFTPDGPGVAVAAMF